MKSGGRRGLSLLAGQEWRCAYCGYQWPRGIGLKRIRRLCRDRPPTLDHKTPIPRGGNNELENFCVACQFCNTRKGMLTEAEYRAVMHDKTLWRRAIRQAQVAHQRPAASPGKRAEADNG